MSSVHKTKICEMKYINVPIPLLQEAKDDGLLWSLVSLCVAMKCFSPSSTYRLVSLSKFCRDFHVGKGKAMRLVSVIREGHPLFRYERHKDGRVEITALSLRKHYGHWLKLRDGRHSLAMSVVKASVCDKDNIRLKSISEELRMLLLGISVCSKARADELQSKGLPLTGASSHAARTILSVNYLAKAAGRSGRSIIRMTQKAQQRGLFRPVTHPLRRVCDDVMHCQDYISLGIVDPMLTPTLFRPRLSDTKELILIGNLGFERQCNDYQLLSWDFRRRFQHIIYSHRGRLTHTVALRKGEVMSQLELHALYD